MWVAQKLRLLEAYSRISSAVAALMQRIQVLALAPIAAELRKPRELAGRFGDCGNYLGTQGPGRHEEPPELCTYLKALDSSKKDLCTGNIRRRLLTLEPEEFGVLALELVAEVVHLPFGCGLLQYQDHGPGVVDGLGFLDTFFVGDPSVELGERKVLPPTFARQRLR